MSQPSVILSVTLLFLLSILAPVSADEIDDHLRAISRTGPNGAGSAAAREARDGLARRGPEILPRLVAAMDTPNVVAANWVRTVYEEIVARELEKPQSRFPLDDLKAAVRDAKHHGKVRRLVLELVDRLEPEFGKALIPTLLDDREFRPDAVARVLAQGDEAAAAGDKEQASELYRRAFTHARQADQVTTAAARLKQVGVEVSIVEHLGFIIDWHLLGPFNAPEYTGFAKSFPPEQRVDLAAEYEGQNGEKIRWKQHTTTDPMGTVNLIDAVARTREAVAYAYAEIDSPRDQSVELRCGADDNLSVWLNGEKVFAREQWLNGTRLDRFIVPVKLTQGTNHLLVKVCQGPQHVDPLVPNNWTMQLRFCNAEGAGVGVKPVGASK